MTTPCETLRNELIDLAKGEANEAAQAHIDTGCVTCTEELAQLRTDRGCADAYAGARGRLA